MNAEEVLRRLKKKIRWSREKVNTGVGGVEERVGKRCVCVWNDRARKGLREGKGDRVEGGKKGFKEPENDG